MLHTYGFFCFFAQKESSLEAYSKAYVGVRLGSGVCVFSAGPIDMHRCMQEKIGAASTCANPLQFRLVTQMRQSRHAPFLNHRKEVHHLVSSLKLPVLLSRKGCYIRRRKREALELQHGITLLNVTIYRIGVGKVRTRLFGNKR